MSQSSASRLGTILVVGAFLAFCLVWWNRSLNPTIAGDLFFALAHRHGWVPYRDFYLAAPPGMFLLGIGIPAVFGDHLIAFWAVGLTLRALAVAVLYRWLRREFHFAVAACAVLTGAIVSCGDITDSPYFYHHIALAFATLGAASLAAALESRKTRRALAWAFAAGLLLALRAIVRERPRQAALFGLALVFTKEPGVLLYALATGLWALISVARREGTVPEKLRRLARAWPLSLPLAAFGGFMVFRSRGGVDPLWHNFGHVSLLDTFTTFRLLDQSFIGQLLGIFVLQFAWLATLIALPRWIRMAVRAALALGPGQPPALFYFDALLFAATLLLTRYQTFLNLRYYVAAYPLLLVCAFAGLRELSPARLPRLTTLGVLAVLFFASALRTVDPVSKAAMGTVRFGEHEMLDMTRATGECCGHGRDQLCYNLEHLHLHSLENLLLDDLHARQSARVLASAALGEHHTVGRLDLKTWRRTLAHEDTVLPRVFIADDLDEGQRPPNVVFIRFFFVDNAPDEARIRRLYDEVGEKTYDIHGYRLTAVDYRLREPPGNPLAPRAVVR